MRQRNLLILILFASYLIRLKLAWSGGQEYWPDEGRFYRSRQAVEQIAGGNWTAAGALLAGQPDHPLFTWFGLIPAGWEKFVAGGQSPRVVTVYFALFPVLAILLIWTAARRAGAGESEALWAAFLAACSNTLFYYSRHYFPYDISLCFMLGALAAAVGPSRRVFLAGVLAGLGFLAYSGYWIVGGAVLALTVAIGPGGVRGAVGRAGVGAAGLIAPLALFALAARALGFHPIDAYRAFAGTVTQGDFHAGYRVIAGYLWSAERLLIVLLLAGAAFAVALARRDGLVPRLRWWLGGASLIVGALILFSDVVPRFVVYGRLVRAVVPFLCLAAAAGFDALRPGPGLGRVPRLREGLAIGCAVMAAFNFAAPLAQEFPVGFQAEARRAIAALPGPHGQYRVIHAEHLWGADLGADLPPHEVIRQAAHPLQYRPYQYEAFSVAERAELNRAGIAMELIRLSTPPRRPEGPADPALGEFMGPIRLRLRFPADGIGRTEPLVVSGVSGRGDLIWVRYQDAATIQFGLDHWGIGSVESPLIRLDYAVEHEVVISAGPLLPPSSPLKRHLLIAVDGRPILSGPADYHPSTPDDVTIAENLIGSTTTRSRFTGEILSLGRVPVAEAARLAER